MAATDAEPPRLLIAPPIRISAGPLPDRSKAMVVPSLERTVFMRLASAQSGPVSTDVPVGGSGRISLAAAGGDGSGERVGPRVDSAYPTTVPGPRRSANASAAWAAVMSSSAPQPAARAA